MYWKVEMTHQPRRLTTYTLPVNEELEGSPLAGCEKTMWACHRFTLVRLSGATGEHRARCSKRPSGKLDVKHQT